MTRRVATCAGGALAVLGLVLLVRSDPSAQQRQLVPAAASSLATHPDTYIGATVSIMAAVEQQISKTAFSVDQDRTKSTGQAVLVLAPILTEPLVLNSYVTVIGEVVRFDPVDVARRLKVQTLDLPADVVARYKGRAVVIATSVLNAEMVDLAKVPPPPLTPEEEAFDAVMKAVGPASNALRAAVAESRTDRTREQTAILLKGFGDAEAFFTKRGNADATTWAGEARGIVEGIDKSVLAGQWAEATTAAGELTKKCQVCHAAYRVRLEDGTYRVKFDR
jgi:hypothetical protein